MQHILRIVTMEVKTEAIEEISFFYKLWNEILSEIMNGEVYKFNPKAIMVDENGAK